MKIGIYLTKKEITSQAFARQLRTSISSVNKWRMGNRVPRIKMIKKIAAATNGSVKLADWYKG